MGPDNFNSALEYFYGTSEDHLEQPEHCTNVFQAGTPGTMSLEAVQNQINLSKWKLKLGSRLVKLEARPMTYIICHLLQYANHNQQDLVGWEEDEISEPMTIKCIAAELAACIGPNLVEKTALTFS